METKSNGAYVAQDTVERYIYQVARRLPNKGRKDIEAELRGSIEDMLEARCGGAAPEKADVDSVLKELGAPAEFAARYGNAEGRPRYLIGPSVFPLYLLVLQYVLLAVSLSMVVVSVMEGFVNADAMNGFEMFGKLLSNLFSGLFSAAAFVTLVFAIFEWRGVKIKALNENWLAELPPVPRKESRISRGDCIGGIVVSALFLLLFVAAPRYIAVFAEGNVIPIFNMALYPVLLPLVVVSCLLAVVKEVAKLLEGRYTLRLAIGVTAADLISVVLCVVILSKPIWNRSLILLLGEALDMTNASFFESFWNSFGQVFLCAVLLGFVVDLISLWVRTLRELRAG